MKSQMSNQTIVFIVLGCVLGLAAFTGLGVLLVHHMMDRQQDFVAGPGGMVMPDDFLDNDMPLPNFPGQAFQRDDPVAADQLPAARGPVVAAKDYRLSGPFTHDNLTVYLVHGASTMKDQQVLTLQEALNQNLAVVHETGTGTLSIDNLSAQPLFIQAGDIVKGGTQDRVLPYDQLVQPNTRRQPLTALCVESGRSRPRGLEISTSFSMSTEQLPSKALKMAAFRQDQGGVWNNVRDLQVKLNNNLNAQVEAPQSQTSLQLTLENPRLQEGAAVFQEKLAGSLNGKDDVIGYVVAINGRIHNADIYASSAMFEKLWPKLLRASAVEALAEPKGGQPETPPSTEAVQTFLTSAEAAPAFQQDLGRGLKLLRQEGQNMLFDTCDANQGNLVLHRSVLAK